MEKKNSDLNENFVHSGKVIGKSDVPKEGYSWCTYCQCYMESKNEGEGSYCLECGEYA